MSSQFVQPTFDVPRLAPARPPDGRSGRPLPGASPDARRPRAESASGPDWREPPARVAGTRPGGARGPRRPAPQPGVELCAGARRLLAALGEPGAFATVDPLDDSLVAVRVTQGGVTLRRAAAPLRVAAALVDAGLAAWARTGAAPLRLAATDAGRARLRREAQAAANASAHANADRADGDDPYAAQHRETALVSVATPEGPQVLRVDLAESPLARLQARRDAQGRALLSPSAFAAGERLRADLTCGGLLPSVSASWGATRVDGASGARDPAAAADSTVAARQRATAALDAVGSEFSGLLLDVCGFLKGLEVVERERGWPGRSARVVLSLALSRLAAHYGLTDEAAGAPRRRARRPRADRAGGAEAGASRTSASR